MKVSDIKDRIIYDESLRTILEALHMRNVKDNGDHLSCGMPDGNNKKSTIVYKDSLYVDAHTRNIKDNYGSSDIISLVLFIKKDMYFTSALKWICDVCGYDYYGNIYERPLILDIFAELAEMRTADQDIEEHYNAIPINEYLLTYFNPLKSKMFHVDGISYNVQKLFDIRYDAMDDRIIIPIRDESGILVGLKGRLNRTEVLSFENKYIYLTKCNKSSILFGLQQAYDSIKELGIVYVSESEKGVLQAFSKGIHNVVAIGGKKPSKTQVKKLTHLGVEVCMCYDDGANIGENDKIDVSFYKNQKNQFIDGVKVSHIIDKKNKILGYKESPFDNMNQWEELLNLKRDVL